MGQSKDGGYMQKPTTTAEQGSFISQLLSQGGIGQQAMQGLSSYLPGGSGADPIAAQANRGFEQQTLPSIMEALGTGVKSSSGLNQTMGAAGADLQSQLASLRSQMGLQAAGQGMGAGMQAAGESQFAYMPKQMPFWQQATLGLLGAGGQIGGGLLSNPSLFAKKSTT